MWEVNGIVGRDEKPPLCAGTESGVAAVLGSGRCIWDDLQKLEKLISLDKIGIIAINNMIMHYHRRVHHAVSLHPEEPPLWVALRKTNHGDTSHTHTHSHRIPKNADNTPVKNHGLDYIWDIELSKGGSSGLLATMIGLALGYNKIILAGVPLDGSGHFFDPAWEITRQFSGQNIDLEWKWANDRYIKGRVKSLSGRTRDWFGEPTEEWVNG